MFGSCCLPHISLTSKEFSLGLLPTILPPIIAEPFNHHHLIMELKSKIDVRIRNIALLIISLYHTVKRQKFYLMLFRRITCVNVTEDDARNAVKKTGMDKWLIDALRHQWSSII